jgi:hypothetical protein
MAIFPAKHGGVHLLFQTIWGDGSRRIKASLGKVSKTLSKKQKKKREGKMKRNGHCSR